MQFFDYGVSTGYEMLRCDDERWEVFSQLDGTPVASSWKPLRVKRVRVSRREAFRPSDSPYHTYCALVFRRSAIDALQDILDAHGELLPLEDEGGVELYAYNPRALDAFDQVQSIGSLDKYGKISNAVRHVFIPSVVEGVDIFKHACDRAGAIYVSRRFFERWRQAKLKGLDFRLVWDSKLPPDKQPGRLQPAEK
jgi:hypothetical protein